MPYHLKIDKTWLMSLLKKQCTIYSMELEEEEEFAEFVFAAAFDVDDVNTELL